MSYYIVKFQKILFNSREFRSIKKSKQNQNKTALKKEKNEKYYHEVSQFWNLDENVQEFLRYIFSQKSNEHEQHFICNLEMRRT